MYPWLSLRLGVILGDCVHNLRSCLDHVIWQVTLLDGGVPNKATQFPIVSQSEAEFEKTANRQIPGLSDSHRELVKNAQPFRRPEPKTHLLAVLAELSNTDKHRLVHTTFSVVGWDAAKTLDRLVDSYRGEGPSPVHSWWLASSGRLEHDTPWFRIEWRRDQEPPQQVKLAGEVTCGVAFGEVGLALEEFNQLADAVRVILERFMADFPETEFVDAEQG